MLSVLFSWMFLPLFAPETTVPRIQDAPKAPSETAESRETSSSIAKQRRKKERELDYWTLQFEIDQRKARAEYEASEAQLVLLREKHELAREELDDFAVEARNAERRAQSRIERSEWNVEAQRQELQELRTMYEKEEFAELTKELVLERGERQLRFASTDLGILQVEVGLEANERARKARKLAREVAETERGFVEQRSKQERMELEHSLANLKSEHQRSDLEEELAELQAKEKNTPSSIEQRVRELEELVRELKKQSVGIGGTRP